MTWNRHLLLAFSDVDETIAGLHEAATAPMVEALSAYLQDGGRLCLITGGSLDRVTSGVTDLIDPLPRSQVLVAPACGAELWGFREDGSPRRQLVCGPESVAAPLRHRWELVMSKLMSEFDLRPHPARAPALFWDEIGRDPHDVMFSDRGVQMGIEFVNGTPVEGTGFGTAPAGDLREAVRARAAELLRREALPVSVRPSGVFALNLALDGVSKGGAVSALLAGPHVLASIGLTPKDLVPDVLEVWGDDFSAFRGGIDLDISKALPPSVRTIDFRDEDPAELPADRNVVLWDGRHRLHAGLLEFLETREVAVASDQGR